MCDREDLSKEFVGDGNVSEFHALAFVEKPTVELSTGSVVASRRDRTDIQERTECGCSGVSNGPRCFDTGSGLIGSGTESDKGSKLSCIGALSEEVGSNDQSRSGAGANAGDARDKLKELIVGLSDALMLSRFELFNGFLERSDDLFDGADGLTAGSR